MPRLQTLLLVVLLGSFHLASAAEPDAKSQLDTLAFYEGNWTCKGVTFATAKEPKEEWAARMEVKRELSKTWYSVKMIGPEMNETSEHKGYDPKTKRWVHIWVASEAGSWGVMDSPGWEGNKMVFTEKGPGTPSLRATFTKVSDTQYSHREDEFQGGKWVPAWEKSCVKVK